MSGLLYYDKCAQFSREVNAFWRHQAPTFPKQQTTVTTVFSAVDPSLTAGCVTTDRYGKLIVMNAYSKDLRLRVLAAVNRGRA